MYALHVEEQLVVGDAPVADPNLVLAQDCEGVRAAVPQRLPALCVVDQRVGMHLAAGHRCHMHGSPSLHRWLALVSLLQERTVCGL